MIDIDLCPPAIIYLIFSITQILIDLFKGLYNTAVIKVIVTVMVTFLLNILCKQGLTVVSWIIVFVPFILMTVVVSIILYVFGLNATKGTVHPYATKDNSGNILVYDPSYNAATHPFYYSWPNVVVQNPDLNPNTNANANINPNTNVNTNANANPIMKPNNNSLNQVPPNYSSSPAYQSE